MADETFPPPAPPPTPAATSGGTMPAPASPAASEALPPVPAIPKRSLAGKILPFVPIVLALAVALIARHWQKQPPMPPGPMMGMKAPDFSLKDAHKEDGDEPVTLSILADKSPVLLVFYMGYSCPKCMGHLHMIADVLDDFQKAHVQVLAISPYSPANTRDSITMYGDLPFPLLSDPDGKVAQAYHLVDADGNALHGMFIVDQERRIQYVQRTSEPYTDIDDVLQAAQKLQAK